MTCEENEDCSDSTQAGDGIRVNLDVIDDGFASYDLDLRFGDRRIHESRRAGNQEAFEHNVDADGEYLLRVFGALEGRADLSIEVIPGGIEVIPCNEMQNCGADRICQAGADPQCVSETCWARTLTSNAVRYLFEDSGQCICEARDQFMESNDAPQAAAAVNAGFAAARPFAMAKMIGSASHETA